MTDAERANLEALLSVLRTQGVRKFRSGDLFIELGPEPFVPSEADAKFDPNKCQLCQARPLGRIQKGLCRECALTEAGVSS